MPDLKKQLENLQVAYESIKQQVRWKNKDLYERWKAGGFLVDNDIISMYPHIEEVVEQLVEDDELDHLEEDAEEDEENNANF